jgi:hypothetical protein
MEKSKTLAAADVPDVYILKTGRHNNIIQWRDEIGSTGSFLMTKVAYVDSMPCERNFDLFYTERLQQEVLRTTKTSKRAKMTTMGMKGWQQPQFRNRVSCR